MNIVRIILTGCLILAPSIVCYGEINFMKLYGLVDKNSLEKIIYETERAIETNPSDKDNLKLIGIAYHNLGVLEAKGVPKKAVEYLEKAYRLSPDDYEILAYLGSAKTMVARDSWNVFTKASRVNEGINTIDRAVSKSPDNIAIRMVRANNTLKLPEFLNRRHIAKEDFLYIERLIEGMENNPLSPFDKGEWVDPDTKGEVFYQIGMIYKSEGNETLSGQYLKKAVDASPDSRWGIEAKKESERLGR